MKTKKYTQSQKLVLNALRKNNGHWLSGADLQTIGCYEDRISLRYCIRVLRLNHYPIIADPKLGYKYTNSKKQLKEYISSRSKEIDKELAVLAAMSNR